MRNYTVHLFRSGRVWVQPMLDGTVSHDVDPPLLTENVQANSEIAALGKLLLKYVDAANQTDQHVRVYECLEPCCNEYCVCGAPSDQHTPSMSQPHTFTPARMYRWDKRP